MYITGTMTDFGSRLHQLPGSSMPTGIAGQAAALGDINTFLSEGRVYINAGLISAQISGKWEQEARKQRWLLSGDSNQMLMQQF